MHTYVGRRDASTVPGEEHEWSNLHVVATIVGREERPLEEATEPDGYPLPVSGGFEWGYGGPRAIRWVEGLDPVADSFYLTMPSIEAPSRRPGQAPSLVAGHPEDAEHPAPAGVAHSALSPSSTADQNASGVIAPG